MLNNFLKHYIFINYKMYNKNKLFVGFLKAKNI